MIANDEPGCLSVMWQIMSWWLIAKSHSASTRGAIVMQTGGGKRDFTRFLHPISRQKVMVMLLAELVLSLQRQNQIFCCCIWERSYKKTTSMSPSEIWSPKKKAGPNPSFTLYGSRGVCPFQLRHLWWINDASLNGDIVLFIASFLPQTFEDLRSCSFLMFIDYSIILIAIFFQAESDLCI